MATSVGTVNAEYQALAKELRCHPDTLRNTLCVPFGVFVVTGPMKAGKTAAAVKLVNWYRTQAHLRAMAFRPRTDTRDPEQQLCSRNATRTPRSFPVQHHTTVSECIVAFEQFLDSAAPRSPTTATSPPEDRAQCVAIFDEMQFFQTCDPERLPMWLLAFAEERHCHVWCVGLDTTFEGVRWPMMDPLLRCNTRMWRLYARCTAMVAVGAHDGMQDARRQECGRVASFSQRLSGGGSTIAIETTDGAATATATTITATYAPRCASCFMLSGMYRGGVDDAVQLRVEEMQRSNGTTASLHVQWHPWIRRLHQCRRALAVGLDVVAYAGVVGVRTGCVLVCGLGLLWMVASMWVSLTSLSAPSVPSSTG